MSESICVLCFSFSNVLKDIKHTRLQKVYEELSDKKIQANSHPLCYICYAKLRKCQQLIKKIQQDSASQNRIMENRVEPENFTNEGSGPSMSEPMKVENDVASLATPFAQPIIAAAKKSKAERQREYRQRIAASRTPAQAAAARKLKNERQRKNRLRQAAKLAIACSSLEDSNTSAKTGTQMQLIISKRKTAAPKKTRAQIQREYRQRIAASKTSAQAAAEREARNARDRNNRLRQAGLASGSKKATTTSHRSGQSLNTDHIDTERQFSDQQSQTLAVEPAETTVQSCTSSDQIEISARYKRASPIMRLKSPILDNDFGDASSVCDRFLLKNDVKPITAAQLETQVQPLVQLGVHNTDNCLQQNYEEKFELKQDIKKENVTETVENDTYSFEIEIDIKKEYIEEEPADEAPIEPVDTEHIRTEVTHKQTQDDKGHPCNVCGKKYSKLSYLKRHQVSHADDKPYSCDVCGKKFLRLLSLKSHINEKHTGVEPDKPFACEVCHKRFNKVNSLKRHQPIHSDDRPFRCDVCNKTFKTDFYLKGHKVLHTGNKPYICDYCNKRYYKLSNLKSHIRVIHIGIKPERPHTCEVCDKKFPKLSFLRSHQQTHEGCKPSYSCDVCGKKVATSFSLKRHQRTHVDGGPYRCDVCRKTFCFNSDLQTHKLTHTGDKPHGCDVCGRMFAQTCNLQRHKTTHINNPIEPGGTLERPNMCDICNKSFKRKFDLKRHKQIHSGKSVETHT